ncbi:MAG: hypothetical protein FD129_653 [bacterium]|nr:MAG: hypothetical protein FD129_653 [bacterium]
MASASPLEYLFSIGREHRLTDPAWRALRATDPLATVFHEDGWLSALTASWSYYRLEWLVARDPGGLLIGAMPIIRSRRYGLSQCLSLPYGAPGTPLATNDTVRGALLAAWWRMAREPLVVRAQATLFLPPGFPPIGDGDGWPASHRSVETTQLLDLSPGFDRIWSDVFDGGIRRSCAKTERDGVTIHADALPESVATLDRLYRAQAGAWRNHTPFPERFLAEVVQRLPESATVWRAVHAGQTIAAQLVLVDRTVGWSWISPNTAEGKRLRAPTLLYRHVIEDLARRGLRWFNFGGSRGNPALEEFKSSLGGRPHDLPTGRVEAPWFRPLHRLQYRLRGIRE